MLIQAYRDVFVQHVFPSIQTVGLLLIIGIVVLLIGFGIFKKLEKGFAEEL